jgi:hypothetical protein
LPGLFQPGMHIALFTISETLIFPCRIIDAEHKALLTSQKLRDLGWKPRKLRKCSQIAWSAMKRQVFSGALLKILAMASESMNSHMLHKYPTYYNPNMLLYVLGRSDPHLMIIAYISTLSVSK